MSEDADTKAKRRRRIKESFPSPLNEIALRHVDTVQALSDTHREMLANVLQKVGLSYLVDCLEILRNRSLKIEDETGLMNWLKSTDKQQLVPDAALCKAKEGNSEDEGYLSKLLTTCYPDMPKSTADALVSSEVMSASLQVVTTTRRALEDAKSDFVITALYMLFEERLRTIAQIINENPAFVKAIQRSRPDWNTKH